MVKMFPSRDRRNKEWKFRGKKTEVLLCDVSAGDEEKYGGHKGLGEKYESGEKGKKTSGRRLGDPGERKRGKGSGRSSERGGR